MTRHQLPVTLTLENRHAILAMLILSAMISNRNKELRVNVMPDPCSASSYISEDAAEELELQGQELNLTITGTGGTEVETQSRRVELTVTNLLYMVHCKLMSFTTFGHSSHSLV